MSKSNSKSLYPFEKLDSAPVMLWVTEKDGSCSFLSKRWYEITGQTPEVALGFGWLEAVHPEDRPKAEKIFLESNKTFSSFEFDYRLRQRDGSYRWAIDSGNPRFNGEGTFEGYTGVVFDIHDRKKIQEVLSNSEERLNTTLNSSNIGFWDWNAHTGHTYLSESLMRVWGIDPSTYKNTLEEALSLIHPDDRENTWNAIQQATNEGSPYDVEYRIIKSDGEVLWINAKGRMHLDEKGAERRLTGITIDITEKRKLEDQLRENAARFQAYAEAMPQMAFISDPKGNMLYFNKRHYEYFDLKRNDEEGWKWTEQNMHHPDDVDRTLKTWTKALETGEEYSIEYRLRRYDGEYRWHLGKATPIKSLEGKIVQWFGTNTDVHESKLHEKELEKRKLELEKSQEDLLKAIASRDEFLSVASHELKTPLTSQTLLFELLRHQIGDNKEGLETIKDLEEQGERLNKLISDLLDITKIQGGHFLIEPENFNLYELLSKLTKSYSVKAKSAKTKIELDCANEIEVRWDKFKFAQVISNLIENAIKYAPGGKLSISAKIQASNMVELVFQDEGQGISEKKQEVIFEKFQRATSSRKMGGLGLGLFITKKIVEMHKGSIRVKSSSAGACFIIEAPLRL